MSKFTEKDTKLVYDTQDLKRLEKLLKHLLLRSENGASLQEVMSVLYSELPKIIQTSKL